MTLPTLIIAGVLALTVVSGLQPAETTPDRRAVVVVDAAAARDPVILAEARAAVEAAGDRAQLRVPRTTTEQLSVTHLFAAQGYGLVVGVGLDRRDRGHARRRALPGHALRHRGPRPGRRRAVAASPRSACDRLRGDGCVRAPGDPATRAAVVEGGVLTLSHQSCACCS